MYSAKASANQLASMMLAHDVLHVVVSPGSRNAPLVHNFSELAAAGKMHVWPVTDERCAAFVAIGLYLATRRPAAVCVTSGSALLNTLPAVAEAYYRHAPLLVISADRPPQDIGQLKGQTIPQQGALLPYSPTWQLPEEGGTICAELCDEALRALSKSGGRPVHINLPFSEPLHVYDTVQLPISSHINPMPCEQLEPIAANVMKLLVDAEFPAIFVGQMDFPPENLLRAIEQKHNFLVLSEVIGSSVTQTMRSYHQQNTDFENYTPDVIVHIGGAGIDKDYSWLVRHENAVVIRVEEDENAAPDMFGRLHAVVRGTTENVLKQLLTLPPKPQVECFFNLLVRSGLCCVKDGFAKSATPSFSQKWMRPISALLDVLRQQDVAVHVGNSSVLRYFRLGHLAPPHLLCNRGVNGIDGSLSVAAGHSLATDKNVFCMLGDLSFFYDCNALWNERLRGNLRILLLNDHGGDIFNRVKGLENTPALPLVAGRHTATAEGICRSYGVDYIALNMTNIAENESVETSLRDVIDLLTAPPDARLCPLVVECFI